MPRVLVVSLLAIGGLISALVTRPWPKTSGRIEIPGLESEVTIVRDSRGVPHVTATSDDDVLTGIGFVHAQDRLFQMDLQRRMALGRLSELVGRAGLSTDRQHRVAGLALRAQRQLDRLSEPARRAIDAYSRGVNAAMAGGRRPLEYRLLRTAPAEWSALDTVAVMVFMQWETSADWPKTLMRERIATRLGSDRTSELFPDLATGRTGAAAPPASGIPGDLPDGILREVPEGLGSNAWAVAGSRTSTGSPMLANDLHLMLSVPGVGYQIGFRGPSTASAGLSIPGIPGVISGHNDDVAFGLAMLRARVQDLYVEELDPDDPDRYRGADGYRAFTVRTEQIRVKGCHEPETLQVRSTERGPVLTDGDRRPKDAGADTRVLTLRWLDAPDSAPIESLLALNRATHGGDVVAALRGWDAPVAVFVYADRHGNIGSQLAGKIPIRACGSTSTPLPAADPAADWIGTVPFEELPRSENPPDGVIVAANQRPVDADYPHFIAPEWCADNRYRRIGSLLGRTSRVTLEDMHAIQTDTVSLLGRRLAPMLASVDVSDPAVRRAQTLLAGWDGSMAPGSTAAAIYQASLRSLVVGLVTDALGEPELVDYYLTREQQYSAFVGALLDTEDSSWWTAGGRTRAEHLAAALTSAVATHGCDRPWGIEHTTTFRHPIYSQVPVLRRLANVRVGPTPGDPQSPFSTGFFTGYEVLSGPVNRQVIDLADWDNHRQMVAVGQSGHLFHYHFRDQARAWRDGGLFPQAWSAGAVARLGRSHLRLSPRQG